MKIQKPSGLNIIVLIVLIAAVVLLGQGVSSMKPEHRIIPDISPEAYKKIKEPFAEQFREVLEYTQYYEPEEIRVRDMEGKIVDMTNYRGSFILINFWASWCAPCLAEIPSLLSLQDKMNEDSWTMSRFKVLFISFDNVEIPTDFRAKLLRMETSGVPSGFSSYYVADDSLWGAFRLAGLPTTVLIGPKGRLLLKMTGDGDWARHDVISFLKTFMHKYYDEQAG